MRDRTGETALLLVRHGDHRLLTGPAEIAALVPSWGRGAAPAVRRRSAQPLDQGVTGCRRLGHHDPSTTSTRR
ncbi:hypothetical protein HUO13_21445 [Saccharopolyspora erythraea]|uniref:hypothetical protein n=1 Tax=Saccharopolyspora erythraea TaxID=1836 RepID=UPI001BAA0C1F|nr:hypothetical protein [Saccharopolyspora erythraea]QUH03045.1 hypothetical protein HUO13_21445 [Saccharopolyspora erythraea]